MKVAIWISYFIVVFSFLACNELSDTQSERVQEALNDSLLTSTETWGVDMDLIEDGEKKVRIRGKYAAAFQKGREQETRIEGPVFIQVFDSTGAVETRVEAERAIYRAEKSEFELFGNVNVTTRNNEMLNTEYLKWSRSENTLSTPKFVVIETAERNVAGTGFTGSANLSNFKILDLASGSGVLN